MATQAEVGAAVDAVLDAGAPALALFHCVSSYPAPPADCNLRAMDTMRAAFGVPVGWSDHTEGIEISLAAIAAGAEILEKHITLDRSLPGPDHAASLEPDELAALMRTTRVIEAAMGDGVKRPRPAELPLIPVARRSLHAARALAEGATLSAGDFVALRPGTGVSPALLSHVAGRPLRRALAAGEMLREGDVG
jgi:sialic acid synthase SpsE